MNQVNFIAYSSLKLFRRMMEILQFLMSIYSTVEKFVVMTEVRSGRRKQLRISTRLKRKMDTCINFISIITKTRTIQIEKSLGTLPRCGLVIE